LARGNYGHFDGVLQRLGVPRHRSPVRRTDLSPGWAAFAANAGTAVRPLAAIDSVALADAAGLLDAVRAGYDAIVGDPV
jgi:hypothetical protein